MAYVAADQEIAEPLLKIFTMRTGVLVRPVYDTEATKTAGLAMRLRAEKDHPQADVFWAGEPSRMPRLEKEGVLAPYSSPEAEGLPRHRTWTEFSSRARVILLNTDLVKIDPKGLDDLIRPEWKGRIGIADPRFGTTAAHAAVLKPLFAGELKANGVRLCAGNGMVRELVEMGELAMGLVDTDDAWAAIDRGRPVRMVVPEPTLVIPNAAGLVAGGPNPEEGRLLLDFLLSAEVEKRLSEKPMRQPPLRGPSPFKAIAVDWDGFDLARAEAFYEALRE